MLSVVIAFVVNMLVAKVLFCHMLLFAPPAVPSVLRNLPETVVRQQRHALGSVLHHFSYVISNFTFIIVEFM